MVDALTYPQQISIPYHYTAGRADRAFLRGLADRRLVGSRHGEEVLVPARAFGPDGAPTGDLVEVGPEGTLTGWTTVARDDGEVTYGLIRLDGATSVLLHRVDAPADVLADGLRLRPRWASDPQPEITAIDAFEPVG